MTMIIFAMLCTISIITIKNYLQQSFLIGQNNKCIGVHEISNTEVWNNFNTVLIRKVHIDTDVHLQQRNESQQGKPLCQDCTATKNIYIYKYYQKNSTKPPYKLYIYKFYHWRTSYYTILLLYQHMIITGWRNVLKSELKVDILKQVEYKERHREKMW